MKWLLLIWFMAGTHGNGGFVERIEFDDALACVAAKQEIAKAQMVQAVCIGEDGTVIGEME